MILLILFGLIYNGALRDGFSDMRYASVLSQIGIGYFWHWVGVLDVPFYSMPAIFHFFLQLQRILWMGLSLQLNQESLEIF